MPPKRSARQMEEEEDNPLPPPSSADESESDSDLSVNDDETDFVSGSEANSSAEEESANDEEGSAEEEEENSASGSSEEEEAQEDEDEDDDDDEEETQQSAGAGGKTATKKASASANPSASTKKKSKKKKTPTPHDEDDEELRQNMFQRLQRMQMDSVVLEQHPEVLTQTMEEVQANCVIQYNANGMIQDDKHKTTPILTKYEQTRILGQRTKQLNAGAPCLLDGERPNILDNYQIALMELQAKKLPFIIRRPLPGGVFEYWRVADLQQVL